MTPAEQGQERWEIWIGGSGQPLAQIPGDPVTRRKVEVVPAEESEMAMRYFPFMRRSRDEAERKLSACQGELARVRDAAYLDAEEQDAKLEAVETARDEAVKREKALMESEDELATELAEERVLTQGLVMALENALAAVTESETRHIIYAALDQSGKP